MGLDPVRADIPCLEGRQSGIEHALERTRRLASHAASVDERISTGVCDKHPHPAIKAPPEQSNKHASASCTHKSFARRYLIALELVVVSGLQELVLLVELAHNPRLLRRAHKAIEDRMGNEGAFDVALFHNVEQPRIIFWRVFCRPRPARLAGGALLA